MKRKPKKSKISPKNAKKTESGTSVPKSKNKSASATKTTSKFKGVVYTGKVIGKYFPNKKQTPREVYAQLKAQGLKPTIKNIRNLLATKRKQKPEVDQRILNNIWEYFQLNQSDFREEIEELIPENVTIVSNILPKGVEIQGQTEYEYEKTFRQFVDFCNKLFPPPRKSPVGAFVKYKEQINWNSKKNRYEIELISCDEDGNEYDFGFIAGEVGESVNPEDTIEKQIEKPTTKQPTTAKEEVPSLEEKAIEKKIELSKQREKTLQAKKELEIAKEKTKLADIKEEVAKEKTLATKLKISEKFDKMLAKKQISKKTYEQMVKNLWK